MAREKNDGTMGAKKARGCEARERRGEGARSTALNMPRNMQQTEITFGDFNVVIDLENGRLGYPSIQHIQETFRPLKEEPFYLAQF